jgi:hypothetical protein
VLPKIFLGEIRYWNDSAIVALNPKLSDYLMDTNAGTHMRIDALPQIRVLFSYHSRCAIGQLWYDRDIHSCELCVQVRFLVTGVSITQCTFAIYNAIECVMDEILWMQY